MKTLINIIGYRHNSDLICSGHVVDSSSSDCTIFNTDSIVKAGEFLAKLRYDDLISGPEYSDTQIAIMINGFPVKYDEIDYNDDYVEDISTDDYDDYAEILLQIERHAHTAIADIRRKHEESIQIKKQEEIEKVKKQQEQNIARANQEIINKYNELVKQGKV